MTWDVTRGRCTRHGMFKNHAQPAQSCRHSCGQLEAGIPSTSRAGSEPNCNTLPACLPICCLSVHLFREISCFSRYRSTIGLCGDRIGLNRGCRCSISGLIVGHGRHPLKPDSLDRYRICQREVTEARTPTTGKYNRPWPNNTLAVAIRSPNRGLPYYIPSYFFVYY